MADSIHKLTAAELREKERKVIELARVNQAVFNRYVFGVQNQPFHDLMDMLIDKHQYVTFDAPVAHGKSYQNSVFRVCRHLGLYPHKTMAIVGATPKIPKQFLSVIRRAVNENENLHKVFPRLKFSEATKEQLVHQDRGANVKDPNLSVMGIEGTILGTRWDLLITDDMIRFETQHSEYQRQTLWKRFNSECSGRLEPDAQHIDIGTPWVSTDARHKLRQLERYFFLRFDGWTGDVLDLNRKVVKQFKGGLWPKYTVDVHTGKKSGWPRERLEDARKRMPGHDFDRQIRCIALSEAMAIFGDHLDRCCEVGEGIKMQEETFGKMRVAWRKADPRWRYIFTGVDLAVTKKETSDDTAFFTIAPEAGTKHILELRRGKIEGPDILRNMIEIVRHHPLHSAFLTESNATMQYIQQFADQDGLLELLGATPDEADRIRGCIRTTFTGKAKKVDDTLGIRAMTADFERARWVIPQYEDESVALVEEWKEALKEWDPTSHTDDMLMASWLAWEACRGLTGTSGWNRSGIYVPTGRSDW